MAVLIQKITHRGKIWVQEVLPYLLVIEKFYDVARPQKEQALGSPEDDAKSLTSS